MLVASVSTTLSAPVRATDPAATPSQGHILVLDNDRILEGDAERVGVYYRVRGAGGETLLPANKVRCLCANLDEAYRFLRKEANLNDGDEHLRLARFCMLHGLRAQAREEAAAALELRPDNPECRQLVSALKQTEEPIAPPSPVAVEPAENATPSAGIDTAAYGQFVHRVQPVLMNACASCHATGRGGSFKLARTFTEGGLTNRRATQQNLTAVLGMLNRDHPLESPLLTRALIMHGAGEKPPLKGRTEPAYKSLEDWVQFALTAAAPHETPTPLTPPEPKPTPSAAPEKAMPAAVSEVKPSEAPVKSPPTTPDPYDPTQFNRQARPEGN